MKKLITACVFALALAGCSKVTADNYLKLEMGLSKDEVVAILGSPSECSEPTLGSYSCEWKSGEKSISVKFVGDVVGFYSKEGF